jgi:hypothetical protein
MSIGSAKLEITQRNNIPGISAAIKSYRENLDIIYYSYFTLLGLNFSFNAVAVKHEFFCASLPAAC